MTLSPYRSPSLLHLWGRGMLGVAQHWKKSFFFLSLEHGGLNRCLVSLSLSVLVSLTSRCAAVAFNY